MAEQRPCRQRGSWMGQHYHSDQLPKISRNDPFPKWASDLSPFFPELIFLKWFTGLLILFRNFDLTETINYLSNQNKFPSNDISLVMVFCNLWFELWLSDQRWRLFLFQLLHWSFRSKLWEVFRCCRRPRRTPQNHLRKPMLAPRG